MALEKSERYTMVGIDEDSKKAQIITFIRADLNKLDKLCKQYPESYQHVSDQFDEGDELVGKEFICDKKLISFRAPTKRKLTEGQKQAAAERLKKGREKKDAEDKAKAKVENKDKVKDKKETKTKTKSKINDNKDKDKDKQSK